MAVIATIGSLLFFFSLLYLFIHFFRKLKNRNKQLSKKTFYPAFIGGLLLFIIGTSSVDNETQEQLAEAQEANKTLLAENQELKDTIKEYEANIKDLAGTNEKLNNDFQELASKAEAAEKAELEKENLTQKIAELEEKNKSLEDKITSLNGQLASKTTTTASTASSQSKKAPKNSSSSGSSNQKTTTTANTTEYFANCTELRKVYPNGVASDHPAYQPKMDRDKDNWACER